MAIEYKTPGVYVQEVSAFPGSVTAVETAVPVFIGYTEKASKNGASLIGTPTRISSLIEFEAYFGGPYQHRFSIDLASLGSTGPGVFSPSMISGPDKRFYLFHCLQLFYLNGGNNCYILSLGGYDGEDTESRINIEDFNTIDVFNKLRSTPGPSLILAPDFVVDRDSCYQLYQHILQFCAETKSLFAILDLVPAVSDLNSSDTVEKFRSSCGDTGRGFGAAYYPWLNTSVVDTTRVSIRNLKVRPLDLKKILPEKEALDALDQYNEIPECDTPQEKLQKLTDLHNALINASAVYRQIMETICDRLNLLPPSSAIAGIYATVDNTRGVWKAPANVAIASVKSVSYQISATLQETMNADAVTGKSVNAIREFSGRGVLVWGARTLDGNNNEWRYINVRRTFMMIEQSLIYACRAWVFEPNEAKTWTGMRAMVENFLNGLWKQGAFQGVKPEEAYHVKIGLGETMTAGDIQNGTLKVLVLIAMLRPAEFISFEIVQRQESN